MISHIDKSSHNKSNKVNNEKVKDSGNEHKVIIKQDDNVSHGSDNHEILSKISSKRKSSTSTKETSPERNQSEDVENIKTSAKISTNNSTISCSSEHKILFANTKSSEYTPSSPNNQNVIINDPNNQVSKNIEQLIGITRPSSLSFPNNQGGNNFNKKGKQQNMNRNQLVKPQNQFNAQPNIPSFPKNYKPNRMFNENDSYPNGQNILTIPNIITSSNKPIFIQQPHQPIAFLSPQLNKITSPSFPSNINFSDLDEGNDDRLAQNNFALKNNQNYFSNGILSGISSAPQTEHLNILNFMSGLNNSIKSFPNNAQMPNQQAKYNGYQAHSNFANNSMQNRGNTVENLHILQNLKVGPTFINLGDSVQRESISQYAEV